MRHIDMHSWPRRQHYEIFRGFNHPHFGMCANVDLTPLYRLVKRGGHSITVAIMYVISRAANGIPEFRYRIRPEGVVEHEVVHPSGTILVDDDLFSFCTIEYAEDFPTFAARAAETIARVKEEPTLSDEAGQDNLLFMSAIPWVSFTSFTHPMQLHPADSVPRFAWGRFFEDGDLLKMPLQVQGHHALMDGIHLGKFYAQVQGYLHHPGFLPGEA